LEQGARKALVIVAHPDDAEFLCAGTIGRWCAEGWEVAYVLVTDGDKGSNEPGMTADKLAAIRREEQRGAAAVLGVKECVFLGYPDGFVEDTVELREKLVREIRRFRPDLVVTWDGFRRGFNHRDHRLTGQVAMDAVYPLSRSHMYFEEHMRDGLSPHEVNEVLLAGTDQPDYYVDIKDFFAIKLKAVLCHQSQVGKRPVEEMEKRMRERAQEIGKEAGYELAESFRRISWAR